MDQTIRKLSDQTIKRLEAQRTWVRNHYEPSAINNYDTVQGKLSLLDTIIKSNWINKDETNKLQCLGIALGDIFVQDLNFSWVEVEDQYGNDPALKLENTSLILFPLTMISKRIEKEETIDIMNLYNELKNKVIELKDKVDKK
jgi:hypothetical protein